MHPQSPMRAGLRARLLASLEFPGSAPGLDGVPPPAPPQVIFDSPGMTVTRITDPIAIAEARVRTSTAAAAAEDLAQHGLRACGLASCGAVEPSVRAFRVCGGCRREAYCCVEHAAQAWRGGTTKRARDAGRGASSQAACSLRWVSDGFDEVTQPAGGTACEGTEMTARQVGN